MALEPSIRRYRTWYATLLRLYPRRFHERFGEPMEQTFNDLLRERAEASDSLFGCAMRTFVDTCGGIMTENKSAAMLHSGSMIRIALATAGVLLLPLIAMQFTDEVAWDGTDFAVAGILLFGAGLTYVWVAGKGSAVVYRIAVGVAVAAALLLVWMNLAVGLIGNEGNPANLLYLGVLAVGIIGAIIARFRPLGMTRALFATALAQAAVAAIALIAGASKSSVGEILMLNGFFVVLFLGSAWLFRNAARQQTPAGEGQAPNR